MRYWIATVNEDRVREGEAEGVMQADHGEYARLRKLSKGDLVVFYSPQTKTDRGKPLQAFTAVGSIADEDPYEVDAGLSFHPWQRRVVYFDCKQAQIRPLIPKLEFIADPFRWGLEFRKGLFEIQSGDFKLIVKAMKADLLGFDKRQD
ncbi:MAG: EVE domain-containing protein [Actinomycetota bacterium]